MSFGPGPLSPALKALIGANVLLFVLQLFTDRYGWGLTWLLGLRPADVLGSFRVWELATYMFLHAGVFHILFNMLALWMFGTELERIWGTPYFLKFYAVTGVGAGALTVLFSLLPFGFARDLHYSVIIGASGAIYGLLLAYGLYFPDRPDLPVHGLSDPGEVLRPDHGRPGVLLVHRGTGRHRQRHASRRPAGRVRVPQARPPQPAPVGGSEISLLEVEDYQGAQQVRRPPGRAIERLEPTRALT